jgi:hypothetical protein
MPQLDCFSYWHQLIIAILLYAYIFILIAFFYAPAIFLRPRLIFLMNSYSIFYIQFIMSYLPTIFTLNIVTIFSSEVFNTFVFDGFRSLYLFYKKNKFFFYALYFSSLSNFNLRFTSKLSLLNSRDMCSTFEISYSQVFFVDVID